jgi:hypothetical protein
LAHDARVRILHLLHVVQGLLGCFETNLVIFDEEIDVRFLDHELSHDDGEILLEIVFDLLSILNSLLNRFARAREVTHSHLELGAQELIRDYLRIYFIFEELPEDLALHLD